MANITHDDAIRHAVAVNRGAVYLPQYDAVGFPQTMERLLKLECGYQDPQKGWVVCGKTAVRIFGTVETWSNGSNLSVGMFCAAHAAARRPSKEDLFDVRLDPR